MFIFRLREIPNISGYEASICIRLNRNMGFLQPLGQDRNSTGNFTLIISLHSILTLNNIES